MKLDAKQRKAIPKKEFGLPNQRAYPMENKNHAIAAKSMASRFATPSQKKEIDAKANKIIKKGLLG
jgi:hypothetical protein